MTFLDKIRQKSHAEKIRLIWIICAGAAVIMVIVWILTSRIRSNMQTDASLFQIIKQSIKRFK